MEENEVKASKISYDESSQTSPVVETSTELSNSTSGEWMEDDVDAIDDDLDEVGSEGSICSDPWDQIIPCLFKERYSPTLPYHHPDRQAMRLMTLTPTTNELNDWEIAKEYSEFLHYVIRHSGKNHNGLLKEYTLSIRNRPGYLKRPEQDEVTNEYGWGIEAYVDAKFAKVNVENGLFDQMMSKLKLSDPECIFDPANYPGEWGPRGEASVWQEGDDIFKFRAIVSFVYNGTEEEFEHIFIERNFPDLESTTLIKTEKGFRLGVHFTPDYRGSDDSDSWGPEDYEKYRYRSGSVSEVSSLNDEDIAVDCVHAETQTEPYARVQHEGEVDDLSGASDTEDNQVVVFHLNRVQYLIGGQVIGSSSFNQVNGEDGPVDDDGGQVNGEDGPVDDDGGQVNGEDGPVDDDGQVNDEDGPVVNGHGYDDPVDSDDGDGVGFEAFEYAPPPNSPVVSAPDSSSEVNTVIARVSGTGLPPELNAEPLRRLVRMSNGVVVSNVVVVVDSGAAVNLINAKHQLCRDVQKREVNTTLNGIGGVQTPVGAVTLDVYHTSVDSTKLTFYLVEGLDEAIISWPSLREMQITLDPVSGLPFNSIGTAFGKAVASINSVKMESQREEPDLIEPLFEMQIDSADAEVDFDKMVSNVPEGVKLSLKSALIENKELFRDEVGKLPFEVLYQQEFIGSP